MQILLDDKPLSIEAGTTILEAAASRNIRIPTFCHLKALKPVSFCSVCVVEIEGEKDLVSSCSTTVVDNMVIKTSTKRVLDARRACVELLLSNHLGDCVGPCMKACPAGIDIPGFISHLAAGENLKALQLIMHNMPLPGILGRVCKRPCEDACRRQLVEEHISICHLKRFAADAVASSGQKYVPSKAPDTGKKVAIVGAGPAGLGAAYYLQLLGHNCTVYDAHAAAGGMLRYGIPSFRLPHRIIDGEVAAIEELGATFCFDTPIGQEITLSSLQNEHDAIFISTGAQKALSLGMEKEDAKGITSATEFLSRNSIPSNDESTLDKRVIVVGGGDVAVDAARVARRMGARDVRIFCLEKRDEMPAQEIEIQAGLAEDITIHGELGVKSIKAKDGQVQGVQFMQCTSVFDDNGAFSPRYDDSSTQDEDCDILIVAIGQTVDAGMAQGVELSPSQSIAADSHTMQTSLDGVFAGGDCVSGPDNAVNAVNAGRKAAIAIDQYVLNLEVVGEVDKYTHSMDRDEEALSEILKQFSKAEPELMPCIETKNRTESFDEIETGFSEDMVRKEAERCMKCGCRDAHECKLRAYATSFEAAAGRFEGRRPEYNLDDSHPDIVYEAHKCIQCRKCVRITEELLGTSSMRVIGRGFGTVIEPHPGGKMALVDDRGLVTIVENCPVGALTLKKDPVATLDPVFKRPGEKC